MPSFDLLVDMKACKLIDHKILFKAKQIFICDIYERYAQVLHKIKDLATMNANKQRKDVKVTHHITTKGPVTFVRALRFGGDKLLAAKKEFEYLMEKKYL